MTNKDIQTQVAIIAGFENIDTYLNNKGLPIPFGGSFFGGTLDGKGESDDCLGRDIIPIPDYPNSRDAIIPVIEKQNFTEEQWETFLRFCVPNEGDWIACNKLGLGTATITQSRLPRAYRMLVLLPANQLCVALLKTLGKPTY